MLCGRRERQRNGNALRAENKAAERKCSAAGGQGNKMKENKQMKENNHKK